MPFDNKISEIKVGSKKKTYVENGKHDIDEKNN